MLIFRKLVIGFLIFWLTLPLPLLMPETGEEDLTDRTTVSIVFNQQNVQKSGSGFLKNMNRKVKNFQAVTLPALIQRPMVDDLLKIEQSIQIILFYFWQGLLKPTRQLLWQMTIQMQRFTLKKMAVGSSRNKLMVYFGDLNNKVETVLDRTIS